MPESPMFGKVNHRLLHGWIVAMFLLFATLAASGQVDQGTITGTVHDPTGAVISNAQITVTDIDAGLTLQTTSNDSGVFVVSPLKIGNYQVSGTASGFQTVVRTNLHLDAQQRMDVNLTLHPGAVSTTVTVTDAPELLQTEDSGVKQVISTQTINDTPLNGRNWVYIAQLTAGVAPGARGVWPEGGVLRPGCLLVAPGCGSACRFCSRDQGHAGTERAAL